MSENVQILRLIKGLGTNQESVVNFLIEITKCQKDIGAIKTQSKIKTLTQLLKHV